MVNNQAILHINVKEKADFSISVNQKHKKFFDDKFSYKMCGILLAKIDANNGKMVIIETIKS